MAEPFRFHRNYTPFTCVICENRKRADESVFISARDAPIPPVCTYCERVWAHARVRDGAHRDRRIIAQISALAARLEALAYQKLDGWV